MKPVIYLFASVACCAIFFCNTSFTAKETYITSDIGRFWEAVDSLKEGQTKEDSIRIIKKFYLNKLTSEGKKFVRIRKYTASRYAFVIKHFPKYFKQLRAKTDRIQSYEAMLDSGFVKLKAAIPGFEIPRVYFGIGCFGGGGTTEDHLLLMGSEIALADPGMDFSEIGGEFHDLLAKGVNLKELIAHESIHCQQHHEKTNTLLAYAIKEGGANFLSTYILNNGSLPGMDKYGLEHECELWNEFKPAMTGSDKSQWFYNMSKAKNKPADLGYFVGMRICETYYNKQTDKQKAIKTLLDLSKFQEVLEQSDYDGKCGDKNK